MIPLESQNTKCTPLRIITQSIHEIRTNQAKINKEKAGNMIKTQITETPSPTTINNSQCKVLQKLELITSERGQ